MFRKIQKRKPRFSTSSSASLRSTQTQNKRRNCWKSIYQCLSRSSRGNCYTIWRPTPREILRYFAQKYFGKMRNIWNVANVWKMWLMQIKQMSSSANSSLRVRHFRRENSVLRSYLLQYMKSYIGVDPNFIHKCHLVAIKASLPSNFFTKRGAPELRCYADRHFYMESYIYVTFL